MKLSFGRLVLGVILTITVLGLLRYRPWTRGGSINARDVIHEGSNKKASRELTVGFLPVTCHLTCPVTDFASKTSSATRFDSLRFTDFPTVVESIKSGRLDAT